MSLTLTLKSWLNIEERNESLMLKYGQTDDSKYLQILVRRLNNDLYHFLLSQSDKELAEDICQQVWIKVIDNRRSYSDTGSFKSWIFKMARFSLIDELRRQQRWNWQTIEQEAEQFHELSLSIEQNQFQQQFDSAFKKLPFLQREAFMLQQEGLRLREIATITATEIETVKTRLRYAKQTLKGLLQTVEEQDHD